MLERLSALLSDDVPVALLGEAGVGKTTLLRAAAESSGRSVHVGGALSTSTATLDVITRLAGQVGVLAGIRSGEPGTCGVGRGVR